MISSEVNNQNDQSITYKLSARDIQRQLFDFHRKFQDTLTPFRFLLPKKLKVKSESVSRLINDSEHDLSRKFDVLDSLFKMARKHWLFYFLYRFQAFQELVKTFNRLQENFKQLNENPEDITTAMADPQFRKSCDKNIINRFISKLSVLQVYELIARYWSEDEFNQLGLDSIDFNDICDAFIPENQRIGANLSRLNSARIKLGLPQFLPDNYQFPGAKFEELQKMSPEMLYQLEDDDIRAGELRLQQLKKQDSEIEFLLIPFSMNMTTQLSFQRKLESILASYETKVSEKPIVLHGTLHIDNNHYLPFFIYKNPDNQIYIYTINPSAQKRPDQSNSAVKDFFERLFPGCLYADPQITQQLEERNCALNSLQTQEDALCAGLFSVENYRLKIHPERLTINGNKERAIYYKDNLPLYIYPEALKQQGDEIRNKWAEHFNTVQSYDVVNTVSEEIAFTLDDLRNDKDAKRFERFPYHYSYKDNILKQQEIEKNSQFLSDIKGLLIIQDCKALKRVTQQFVEALKFPNEQDYIEICEPLKSENINGLEQQERFERVVSQAITIHLKEQLQVYLEQQFEAYCATFDFHVLQDVLKPFKALEGIQERLAMINKRDFLLELYKKKADYFLKGYYKCHQNTIKSLILQSLDETTLKIDDAALADTVLQDLLAQSQISEITLFLQQNESKLSTHKLATVSQLIHEAIDQKKQHYQALQYSLLAQQIPDYSLEVLLNLIKDDQGMLLDRDGLAAHFCDQQFDKQLSLSKEQLHGQFGHDWLAIYETEIIKCVCEAIKQQLQQVITKKTMAQRLTLSACSKEKLLPALNNLCKPYVISESIWQQINAGFGADFFKKVCKEWLDPIINLLSKAGRLDCSQYLDIKKTETLLLENLAVLNTPFPQLFKGDQLNLLGKLFARLLNKHFLSLTGQWDEKIRTLQQHYLLVGIIQHHLKGFERGDLTSFLIQMKEVLGRYQDGLQKTNLHLQLGTLPELLNQCDRVLHDYYSALALMLQTLLRSELIDLSPGNFAYQAFTLLSGLINPEQFYLSLHPKPINIGLIKEELCKEDQQFLLENALRVHDFLPAIFRKPKTVLSVVYQISETTRKTLSFPPLTKGIILDCLDFISATIHNEFDSLRKLKDCLEVIYTDAIGDLETPISNYKALKSLLQLFPSPENLFTADNPTREQAVVIYLLKTAELFALWHYAIDLNQTNEAIKREIDAVTLSNNLYNKISLQEFFDQIIQNQEYSTFENNSSQLSVEQSICQLKRNWAAKVNQFQKQLQKEKAHLPKDQRRYDPVDALRMQQFVAIHHRLDDWKLLKESINKRYQQKQGASSAQEILAKNNGLLTYAVLYELSVFWQSNHHELTTVLRPGRWFSDHGKPRVMFEIDLLLQRFERNLGQKKCYSEGNDPLEDQDKKALQMISKLYATRSHFPYFKTARSAEIVQAINTNFVTEAFNASTESECLNELADCYGFDEPEHRQYYVANALDDLRKPHCFFAVRNDSCNLEQNNSCSLVL